MKRWKKILFLLFLLFLLIILPTVITNLEGFDNQKKCYPIGIDSRSRPYKEIKKLCEQRSCKEDSRGNTLCPGKNSGCKVWYNEHWHCCSKGCCNTPCPPNKPPSQEVTPYKPHCNKGSKPQKIKSYEEDSFGHRKLRINYGQCIECEDDDTEYNCRDRDNGRPDHRPDDDWPDDNWPDNWADDDSPDDEDDYGRHDHGYNDDGTHGHRPDDNRYDDNRYDDNRYDNDDTHDPLPDDDIELGHWPNDNGTHGHGPNDDGIHGHWTDEGPKIPKPYLDLFIP